MDDVDRVTISALRNRLELDEEIHAAGLDEMSLNVIASPLQDLRDVFDLMPQDTEANWTTFATRMTKLPAALGQYREALLAARDQGRVAPRRQVTEGIQQCADLTADDGYFATLVAGAKVDGQPLAGDTKEALAAAAAQAADAYRSMGEFLRAELLDAAPGGGRLRDRAVPADVALLRRRDGRPRGDVPLGHRGVRPPGRADARGRGADQARRTVKEAIAALEADPAYQLQGKPALKEWMQTKADEAIAQLADVHFDIPEPMRTVECMIAPTEQGGIYYTPPSDDFSRPGRMWWSVPKGITTFGTWKELTTVYHEGVPGHHLQCAQAVYRSELLNKWRRLDLWISGHGEGWALYAERLMAELGYMEDPGHRMGWLDGQSLRAARVVIDIGVHCGFDAPDEVGGGAWTYDKAWQFLTNHANQGEAWLRFELNRYLGWPGQAPSYKIGERLWLSLREEARAREGAAFDLKVFHRKALDLGGVPLDTLRSAVLDEL